MRLLLALVIGLTIEAARARAAGLVLEEVQEDFAGERAGLRAGDVLLHWERAPAPPANPEAARGPIDGIFALLELEREQAPRGAVTLSGTRDGEPFRAPMPSGQWRIRARPALPDALLAAYEEARRGLEGGDHGTALRRWRELALASRETGDAAACLWIFYRIGVVAGEKRSWPTADDALQEARREAEAAGDASTLVQVLSAIARSREDRSEWDAAAAAYREALERQRAIDSPSLGEGRLLRSLGVVAEMRGDAEAAQEHHRRALALQESLAPESLEVATTLHVLGREATTRGDLDAAETHHGRARAIRERLAPEGMEVAASLNNLGMLAGLRGDLAGAEGLYRRTLAIYERLEPRGLALAAALHNLGNTAQGRGDLVWAEDCYRRALELKQALAPDSLSTATTLSNLGLLAEQRGDLAGAEAHARQALAVMEKVAPEGLGVAATLETLAAVKGARADLPGARILLTRALAIKEKVAPESLRVAGTLAELGALAAKQADAATARHHLERALAIVDRAAPRGPIAATTTRALGDVALSDGDLDRAETCFRRSLDILRELAPHSAEAAESGRRLAFVERRRGRLEPALALYREALDALDAQRGRLGGADEAKTRFGARYAGYYREAMGLLMELQRADEAFHVLERCRARGLLALMAERDIVFSADVPEELERERRRANAEYDRALARVGESGGEAAVRQEALAGIRRRQAQIQDRIRAASPRFAALHYPEPLNLAAARAALDPGTLLLSYSIGETKSYVFAIGPGADDFTAAAIDVDRQGLRDTVSRLRHVLQQGGGLRRRALERDLQELGAALLSPVAPALARAERVLVLPDGPLHLVPFAALGDPASPRRFRYLVEGRPVHVAASATVFAQLAKSRQPRAAPQMLAFGDPDYTAAAPRQAPAAWRTTRERGPGLRPLPASRKEVAGLRQLYPDSVQTYLGAEATEERAKSVGRDVSVLHFACHGLADEDSPLESSLALALPRRLEPGRENGLLQAWEIFEQLRIDADLVTLSACGTALGREMSGEGILGLSRAFQYAGARSVLASLWEVGDSSTADLMARFYGHLKRGRTKDDALRAAQLEMIRRPSSSHPYHWAAFQLIGDWR